MIDPKEAPEGYIAERAIRICFSCAFADKKMEECRALPVLCFSPQRKDKTSVIFKPTTKSEVPMMKMKYIMCDFIFPVIWHGPMNHCDARLLCATDGKVLQPTSAGFIEIVDGRLICSGESTTLGMKPSPEDAELLAKYFGVRHEA